METCENGIYSSGASQITDGYKCVFTNNGYERSSYALPSSVRVYNKRDSGNTTTLNNGLVWFMSHNPKLSSSSLPRTVRNIEKTYEAVGQPLTSLNDGLLRIGTQAYMAHSGSLNEQVPTSFPNSLKYVGYMAFYDSNLNGKVKMKAPFIDERAFEGCSGITEFDLDVSDVENNGSYLKQDSLATYRDPWSSLQDGPPLTSIPLKKVSIKGYETIDDPLATGWKNPLLNSLEIEGNGKTVAALNEVNANYVEFGDGIVDLRGTWVCGWKLNSGATYGYEAIKAQTIIFGKDIIYVEDTPPWTDGVLHYGCYAANAIYITKDNGVFLDGTTVYVTGAFGACDTIYVPSSLYQEYITSPKWASLRDRIRQY